MHTTSEKTAKQKMILAKAVLAAAETTWSCTGSTSLNTKYRFSENFNLS